jgi:tetratricopeptide (TPR) repeat protein
VVIIACIIGIFFVLGFIVLYILSVTKIFEELVINDRNIEAILGDKSMNPNELNIDNTLHLDFSEMSNSKKQDILNYLSKNGVNNLDPILSKRLGKFLFFMKEYDRAAKAYKAAYMKDPEDKYSLLNYCFIKSKYLKDFDSSNEELKELIAKNKKFAPAYYNLACNYNREYLEFKETSGIEYIKKLKDKAEENLQKAFELDKGLFSEALKDSELKELDIKQIFINSKMEE